MPSVTIELPEELFKRLQALAEPLVDTPVTVLTRLLDHYERSRGVPPVAPLRAPVPAGGETTDFSAGAVPDLHHTRILRAQFGERTAARWNELVRIAHVVAWQSGRFREPAELAEISGANLFPGRRRDAGFDYLEEIDLSIQGIDANKAWKAIRALARHLQLATTVDFEWRQHEKADHPGQRGRLAWPAAARVLAVAPGNEQTLP